MYNHIRNIFRKIQNRADGKLPALTSCLAAEMLLATVLGFQISPGGEAFTLSFIFIAATIFISVCFFMPHCTRYGLYVLGVAALIMTFGAWQNIAGYIRECHSLVNPDFHSTEVFDSVREFSIAKAIATGTQIPAWNGNLAYPLMVSCLFRLFGVNIVWPIALNMGFTLGSITLAGAICAKLMPAYGRRRMVLAGMSLTSCVAGIMMHGTLLLKDAPVIFAVSLFAYAMALTVRGQSGTKSILTAAFAATVLLYSRPMVAVFLLTGVLVVCLRRRSVGPVLYYVALLAAVFMVAKYYIDVPVNTEAVTGSGHFSSTSAFLGMPTVQRYSELVEGYYTWPLWRRLLYLPFVCAVQYFPPFPWNFTRDLWMGQFYWFAHISIGWYVVGGLIIAFYIFCWGRKATGYMNRWGLWWLLCYAGCALYTAGSVPRYYLCFVPMGVPLALYMVFQVRRGIAKRKVFYGYCYCYFLLLVAGLAVAWIFLKS